MFLRALLLVCLLAAPAWATGVRMSGASLNAQNSTALSFLPPRQGGGFPGDYDGGVKTWCKLSAQILDEAGTCTPVVLPAGCLP